MNVRLIEQADIGEAKALWKSAFEDSDEFIDFYFENKLLPGNSIGIFDDGLVCVVHMIPYKIRVQGRAFKSAYIAGAATAEHRRKQGLMKLLLYESLKLMKSRGILLTHLYPFKHSFYEQYGWATYSYAQSKAAMEGKKTDGVFETDDISLLHAMYQNMTKDMNGYVIRSEKEWTWRLGELFADGGKAVVLSEEGVPKCYMLFFEQDGKAEVIETVYESEEHAHTLAAHLKADLIEVKYSLVSQDAASFPHGMARVVDAEGLIKELGAQTLLENFSIKDEFAEWNNLAGGSLEMDIRELTRLVHMGPQRVFGDKKEGLDELLNLNIKASFTCIFEEY